MAIVYISNCTERVFESFQARSFGFVRKSSYLKDIQAVVKMYMGSLKKENGRRLEIEDNNYFASKSTRHFVRARIEA